MSEELIWEMSDCLESFVGEETLKEIFWSLLSFDQRRESLSSRNLRSEFNEVIETLELFASHDGIGVVQANVTAPLSHIQMEQLCQGLSTSFTMLLLLLHQTDNDSWMLIYPDRKNKHHLRFLAIPGAPHELNETARALSALAAFDGDSEESSQRLEMIQRMDIFFPGARPLQRWEFDPELEGTKSQDYSRVKKAAPLKNLYQEAQKYDLLTAEQERGEDLFELPEDQAELTTCQRRLIVHNLRLVINIALKFPVNVLDIEDIVQEGMVGLVIAAQKYEAEKGCRFTTYAWYWIRQCIFRAIHKNQNIIHWPPGRLNELIPANKSDDQTHLDLGERKALLVSRNKLDREAEQKSQQDILELKEKKDVIENALRQFIERDARVLCKRYGLKGMQDYTLEEVGQQEGITRERIRQIQARAEEKLKRILPKSILEEYGVKLQDNEAEETGEETEDLESTTC